MTLYISFAEENRSSGRFAIALSTNFITMEGSGELALEGSSLRGRGELAYI